MANPFSLIIITDQLVQSGTNFELVNREMTRLRDSPVKCLEE